MSENIMTERPTAMLLADYLDNEDFMMSAKHITEAAAELRRLHDENEALRVARDTMGNLWAKEKALNIELLEALRSTGVFLHHIWCDVQMNDYSFQKLNEQMEIVDKVLKK